MKCFSLQFIEQLLVWCVVVGAIVALLRLLVPWVLGQLGIAGGIVWQAINIFLWAIVAIFVIYFIFMLISCLGGVPSFPHGR